ncbi:MAG: hypothetical protein ACPLPS_07745, partial [bacterium]
MVVAEMEIRGIARIDSKTKLLIQRLKKGEIAVIDHKDIDVTSAQLLLERKPAAVINLSPSISGEYPAEGARLLLEKSVPIFDLEEGKLEGVEGEMVEIRGNEVWVNGKVVG